MIQYSSAAFAVVSAILWLASAMVRLPKTIRLYGHHSDVPPGISYTREDIGDVFSPELLQMHLALSRQSRLSAWAAMSAAVAAGLQAFGLAV